MKVRIQIVLPALLLLAGCESAASPMAENDAQPVIHSSAAAPRQVNAVSDALGQRLDGMLAARHATPVMPTR
jgi:hypothetical protein